MERLRYGHNVHDLTRFREMQKVLAECEAGGWENERVVGDWVPDDPICLYTFDYKTKAVTGAVLNRTDMEKVIEVSHQVPDDEIFLGMGRVITSHALARTPAEIREGRKMAAYVAAAYAPRTHTFKQLNGNWAGLHFFVIIYRRSDTESTLRPFAMEYEGSGALLEADTVEEVLQAVVEIDREQHPEFLLPKGEVVHLRPKDRRAWIPA